MKGPMNLYLVSDSSGETVIAASKATIVQFPEVEFDEKIFLLVRSKEQIDEIIQSLEVNPGIVMYTMGESQVKEYFLQKSKQLMIPIISPLDPLVNFITKHFHLDPSNTRPGKYQSLDQEYYSKIDSINFAISHDDGQHVEDYNKADIVLLGVSRTSKSPTSLYLGQRGYKVANYPIILGIAATDFSKLINEKQTMLIGLTISSYNLSKIRSTRLLMLCDERDNRARYIVDNYISDTSVKEEIAYANSLFKSLNIPVIDVTNKAIEESAAEIINLYERGNY